LEKLFGWLLLFGLAGSWIIAIINILVALDTKDWHYFWALIGAIGIAFATGFWIGDSHGQS
jgi:hypothetical protein